MAAAALEKVKKFNNYLFVDTAPRATAPTWARIGKSTEWSDEMNAETETFDYIEDTAPTDELITYKPSASIPHTAYIGDPSYDYIFDFYRLQKTGSDAVTNVLKVYQQKNTDGTANLAVMMSALVTIESYDIAGGILTYSVTQRGTPVQGTAVITDGVPVFTADAPVPAP